MKFTKAVFASLVLTASQLAISAPFDFNVNFEPRGDARIDLSSVKVVYMKSPFVDLTPRLKSAISANGIDFAKADVPPWNIAATICLCFI